MNPERKSRTTRQTEALLSVLDHASANLDYDPDTGTDYGPMDNAGDYLQAIADYFHAFDTTEHGTIAGYAEAVADELAGLRIKVIELETQVDALEFAASTDVRVSSI